jgi:hypothetical protein
MRRTGVGGYFTDQLMLTCGVSELSSETSPAPVLLPPSCGALSFHRRVHGDLTILISTEGNIILRRIHKNRYIDHD